MVCFMLNAFFQQQCTVPPSSSSTPPSPSPSPTPLSDHRQLAFLLTRIDVGNTTQDLSRRDGGGGGVTTLVLRDDRDRSPWFKITWSLVLPRSLKLYDLSYQR
ncbi:hypothetical protein HZH68_003594 [Vespula germanica]|uniref:Uncharacterized protein n=2 Tax=Vespula TaxID=7451 RepID=A0A834NPF5_VESGE|nr:hypothetical protein HZH66_003226 [Vespula vulgaris]KAF7415105.1 hypothetical protein HZH68_003594 [Vespula germanica]